MFAFTTEISIIDSACNRYLAVGNRPAQIVTVEESTDRKWVNLGYINLMDELL